MLKRRDENAGTYNIAMLCSSRSASFLRIGLVRDARRSLGRRLARRRLFTPFSRGRCSLAVASLSLLLPCRCRLSSQTRVLSIRWLLYYDVVLDVEFVVNIHDVYLYALPPRASTLPSTCLTITLATILAFHASGYNALDVEILLVLLTVSVLAGLALAALQIVASGSHISLLLDILRRVGPTLAPRTATSTHRLRGSRVLSGEKLLLGVVESPLVLIHGGPMS